MLPVLYFLLKKRIWILEVDSCRRLNMSSRSPAVARGCHSSGTFKHLVVDFLKVRFNLFLISKFRMNFSLSVFFIKCVCIKNDKGEKIRLFCKVLHYLISVVGFLIIKRNVFLFVPSFYFFFLFTLLFFSFCFSFFSFLLFPVCLRNILTHHMFK